MMTRGRWRRRRTSTAVVQLTLISLMDIFTILLLFLLVHVSGDESVLPAPDALTLPASTARKVPHPTVTVLVTEKEIFVQGKRIMGTPEALGQSAVILAPVSLELTRLADRTKYLADKTASVAFAGDITIMGDKKIPFQLLKKLMATCAQSEFPHIALAVMQKEQIG
ncbi:MAG: biopolymer transporter ExbD [Nitrospirae bacterium]|nr:biopolymer transporter ExbD [Nitrospirota bacterium]